MVAKQEQIQKYLNELLIPALKSNTKNLLDAGMLAERMLGLIQQQFAKTASQIKIKDLEIEKYVDELWAKDTNKDNLEVYASYKNLATAIGELIITDFSAVSQVFGQKVNDYAIMLNKEKQLDDVFKTENKTEDIK